jgi:polysaccharide pyruvyl transferase WcaK-like protein
MKIVLWGPFGTANTGNASTLVTVVARLRSLYPGVELCCVGNHFESDRDGLGITAVPISSRTARLWDRDLRLVERAKAAVVAILQDLREYETAFTTLKGAEMLIVPGTGLLNDVWGLSSWGPYGLFKWSLAARLRRCRLIFLSVGAGPIYTRLGRLLSASALHMAHYRSYRDNASLEVVRSIGVRDDRRCVYPDLVFDLPSEFRSGLSNGTQERRVAGLGLMVYAGRYSTADPSGSTYEKYLESLVILTDWLLAHDYDVRLLLGDDEPEAIEDFREVFRAQSSKLSLESRISSAPARSVREIVSQIATTDVVVATRFHNLLLSLVLERPVIAVSFHHKCASLMNEMGLAEYCFDIHAVDADTLIGGFQRLQDTQDEVKRVITASVTRNRQALGEQYRRVFANAL